MPAGLNWDRLAEEMSANIHLGLEAGECVAPAKAIRFASTGELRSVMAGMSIALVGAWFLNPIPRRSTGESHSVRRRSNCVRQAPASN